MCKPVDPDLTVMLKVKGKRFTCECGSNLFTYTHPDRLHFRCQGCKADYEGTVRGSR